MGSHRRVRVYLCVCVRPVYACVCVVPAGATNMAEIPYQLSE